MLFDQIIKTIKTINLDKKRKTCRQFKNGAIIS